MRMVFSVLSLLVVVAVVGLLARKQLAPLSGGEPSPTATGAGLAPVSGTPQQQLQQVQKSMESVMQAPRPMPDDDKQ